MKVLSIKELLENIKELHGKYVHVQGLLHNEFEGTCIVHFPKNEIIEDHYNSSVYISPAMNFKFEKTTFRNWSGKRVIAGGTVYGPSERFGGCGHMSLWAGQMALTQIDLYNKHFVENERT